MTKTKEYYSNQQKQSIQVWIIRIIFCFHNTSRLLQNLYKNNRDYKTFVNSIYCIFCWFKSPFYWNLIFFAVSVPFKVQRVEYDNYNRKNGKFCNRYTPCSCRVCFIEAAFTNDHFCAHMINGKSPRPFALLFRMYW